MSFSDRMRQLAEVVEDRAGFSVMRSDDRALLEASDQERRALQRELDLIAYTALDYINGNPQELRPLERRKLAQRSRVVWMQDPQAGAAVDLTNDFTFGRGVPRPKCHDEEVQEVVDEAWDDPDNQLVLTSFAAQVALSTDLTLQSNLFVLMFDDGADGKVKLSLLDHDTVENVVRDSENRLRILYYVARQRVYRWNYQMDMPEPVEPQMDNQLRPKVLYYEHWQNVMSLTEEGLNFDAPPPEKMGAGRVFHIAVNRTSEMAFGVPTMQRVLRWFSAYNGFMEARVDMARAAAAYVMKRKIKGTPQQLQKMSMQALSRRSDLGAATFADPSGGEVLRPPKPGSVLSENDMVDHESMKIDSGSANAMQDGQMIRSQISAATRFPQSYFGDASNSNLATATSLELPVLKFIEARQELFEQMFRWFIDRVIEKAVEDGRISKKADEVEKDTSVKSGKKGMKKAEDEVYDLGGKGVVEAYEDQSDDETDTERDLGYDFSMPNPLRRMMTDLISAAATTAQTFDPNNTNLELSRTLLTIVLGEGFEMEDAAGTVEKIYPEGYVDPAVAAAEAQQQAPTGPPGGPGGPPADQQNPYGEDAGLDQGNPYGAPGMSKDYQDSQGQYMNEGRALPGGVRRGLLDRGESLDEVFDAEVWEEARKVLAELPRGSE